MNIEHPPWKPERDTHHRTMTVRKQPNQLCDTCLERREKVLSIDNSDGEYTPLVICQQCLGSLLE